MSNHVDMLYLGNSPSMATRYVRGMISVNKNT